MRPGKGIPPMESREAVPRDQVGRAVGIVGLVGIALIHFLDAFSVIDESRFVFGLYIVADDRHASRERDPASD
jgi:hypothetical protein